MTSSAPSACAKSCAESEMRRSGRSRPSAWRMGRLSQGSAARLRRPDAFDQAAEHDAVDGLQPRFERAVDAHAHVGLLRAAAPRDPAIAVAEQLGIVRRRDDEAGVGARSRDVVECLVELRAVVAGEGAPARRARRAQARRRPRGGARRVRRSGAARWTSLRAARARPSSRSTSVGGGVELAVASGACADRSDADRIFLASKLAELRRKVASACARPAVPACGRGPRSTARSSAATARACAPSAAPSRVSGCLSSASSVTGARPPSAASAASRANTPAGVSASASPPESSTGDVPARQRGEHAARQRAVGRDQRRGLACRLDRLAQRDRDGERLLLGVGGLDHRQALRARRRRARRNRSRRARCQRSVAAAGRSASETKRSRAVRRGRAERAHLVARDADPPQQRLHGELRMADRGRIDSRPSASRRPAIRSQDSASRSVSRPGSTTAPCGSLAMVAISSAVAGIEPVEPAAITGPSVCAASRCRLGLDQRVAPRGRLDRAALGEDAPARPRARSSGIRA